MRQTPFSEQELQQINEMFHAGNTSEEIAKSLGRHPNSISRRTAPMRFKPAQKVGIVPPRTIVNASSRQKLTGGDWIPARIGAMDYAAINSRGF